MSSSCTTSCSNSQKISDDLLAPFIHLCSLSSKNMRGLLVDAFNDWLGLSEKLSIGVKTVINMLHNASLLIDDIEDNSDVRRGATAAHVIYGVPLTINCGNQVYFMALQKVLELPALAAQEAQDPKVKSYYLSNVSSITSELAHIFSQELIELHEGQGMDIFWRDTLHCPTMSEYETMVLKKTGGLFRLALRMMIAVAPPMTDTSEGRVHQLTKLVNTIGVFFQTLDDYLNVCSVEYHHNKTFCEDITEGKFSYPVIHSICTSEEAIEENRLLNILRKRPTDENIKRLCVKLMSETGSLEATRLRVKTLSEEVNGLVKTLGGNPLMDEWIAKMCKLMKVCA
eukprot:Tbor_TRINITY_DN660_c0_g1::TRINITY_DN660_c0_g1_i1::g.1616::m.1616/K00804/GGPS1; geranylgeranyl diphosphate synthase, type III